MFEKNFEEGRKSRNHAWEIFPRRKKSLWEERTTEQQTESMLMLEKDRLQQCWSEKGTNNIYGESAQKIYQKSEFNAVMWSIIAKLQKLCGSVFSIQMPAMPAILLHMTRLFCELSNGQYSTCIWRKRVSDQQEQKQNSHDLYPSFCPFLFETILCTEDNNFVFIWCYIPQHSINTASLWVCYQQHHLDWSNLSEHFHPRYRFVSQTTNNSGKSKIL